MSISTSAQHSPTPSLVRSPTHSTHSSLSAPRVVSNPSSLARRKRPISPALKVAAWQSTMSSTTSSTSTTSDSSYPASPQVATYDEPEPQAPVQRMRDVKLIPDYIIVARCLGETVEEDYQFSFPPSSFHDPASSRNSTATDPRSSYFSDPRSSYYSVPPSDLDLDEQEGEQHAEGEAAELEGVQEEADDAMDDGEPEGIFVPRFIKKQRHSYEEEQSRDQGEWEDEPVAVAIRSEGRGLTNSVDLSVQSPTAAVALKKSKHKFTKSSGTSF